MKVRESSCVFSVEMLTRIFFLHSSLKKSEEMKTVNFDEKEEKFCACEKFIFALTDCLMS